MKKRSRHVVKKLLHKKIKENSPTAPIVAGTGLFCQNRDQKTISTIFASPTNPLSRTTATTSGVYQMFLSQKKFFNIAKLD